MMIEKRVKGGKCLFPWSTRVVFFRLVSRVTGDGITQPVPLAGDATTLAAIRVVDAPSMLFRDEGRFLPVVLEFRFLVTRPDQFKPDEFPRFFVRSQRVVEVIDELLAECFWIRIDRVFLEPRVLLVTNLAYLEFIGVHEWIGGSGI